MATLRKITLNWEIRTGAITCDTGYIKRQELCDVDLYVTVDGTAYALDTSWALNLSIKPTLLGDNAALIAVTTWTASATTGLYQATAQTMGGAALDTYLAANNSDTTDDEGNKLVDLDVYYTISMAVKSKSDTVTLILKPDVGRADDTVPATIIARNDFLVTNGTGLLVNVAAGYAANGAFVAAQSSLAITNATNYIEVTAAGVASVNTTAFTAGSYPLATVVASAGAITSNTDLRAWITPKPAAAGGVTSITGTANEITVTGTTTPTLSLPSALTFTGKTVTGGTFTGGAFNGTVGATTPSSVAGTTGTFSGSVTGATFNALSLSLGSGANSGSVAVGLNTLISATTGINVTAVGAGAAQSNVSGNSITAIGYNAGNEATGSFSTYLGAYAGAHETDGNAVYIDGRNRGSLANEKAISLIYGTLASTAAAQQLTINAGTVTLNGSAVTATSFAGAGSGLTSLNADNISSGTLAAARGGTGVSNTGTITLGGNLVTTGAFNTTFAQAATTTVTLPATSATMARTDAAQTFSGTQTFASPSLIPDGIISAPGLAFSGTTNTGFCRNLGGSADIDCVVAGVNVLLIHSTGLFLPNTSGFNFASGAVGATAVDTTASRNAAGILQIGTTGNNSSGSLRCTNIVALGTLSVTGATTLSAALITTPEALAPALNAGAACGVTTVASGFALNGVNALTLANGTNGQIKTIVCTAVTAAGTATLTPTTCSGFTTVAFTAAGQTLTLQYFTTGGWHLLSVRGATPA